MKITNKHNLPETFVKALSREYHKSANYSASQLTKSPRMVHLENRHYNEIEQDAIDRIWALFGSSVHNILEQGETEYQLTEQYFTENIDGVKISGMSDLYENGTIFDYKITSVWSYIFMADKIDDFESQLNTYAWFYRKAGFKVNGLKIVMILRDWQASKARTQSNYPDCQVKVIDIKLWTQEKTEAYIKERIKIYEDTKNIDDDKLPLCTEKDRWVKPSKYALMKKGRKTAVKVHDNKEDAERHLFNSTKEHYIEERKTEQFKRCEYCSVSDFCNQYKKSFI